MAQLFISYRRGDVPDTVRLLFEKLSARLPEWSIFYDHEGIAPGEPFPDRLRMEICKSAVVLVIIGPRWLGLLHERRKSQLVDHVREEVLLGLQTDGCTVLPLLVQHARQPIEADFLEDPALTGLTQRHTLPLRPDPDFKADLDRLSTFLAERGPGVCPGTVLDGKYKLERGLGEGGMGVVYEALRFDPRSKVAVKVIKPGMDSAEVIARFERERQTLALMNHRNIAQAIDSGSTPQQRPYFVMELVAGAPITAYCDQRRLDPQRRIELFLEVCHAIGHAHAKAVIHRDIKPSNVLVQESQGIAEPKVIDFGLAKALWGTLPGNGPATRLGEWVGTPPYASPEQAAGAFNAADVRSDVYSLGALLHELLAGEPPEERRLRSNGGDAAESTRLPTPPSQRVLASRHVAEICARRNTTPTQLRRMLQGDLDKIVCRALAHDMEERYAHVDQLADNLRRYLRNEPIIEPGNSAVYRLRKYVVRHKAASLTVAAVVTAVLSAVGLQAAHNAEIRRAADRATRAEAAATAQLEHSEMLAYAGSIAQAARFEEGSSWGRPLNAAAAIRILETARPDLRGWEHDYLWSRLHANHLTLRGHAGAVRGVGVSAAGDTIASCGEDGYLAVYDGTTGAQRSRKRAHDGSANGLALAPDGARIATAGSDGSVKLWNSDEDLPLWSRVGHAGKPVLATALSADGLLVVSGGADGTGVVWDAATGDRRWTLAGHTEAVVAVAVSANGSVVATASRDRTVQLWDGRTGQRLRTLAGHDRPVTAIAVSADGSLVVSGGEDFVAIAWDAASGEERDRFTEHTLPITAAAVAAESGAVFTTSGDFSLKAWENPLRENRWQSLNGGTPSQSTYEGHTDWLTSVATTADGWRAVTGGEDGTVRVWGVRTTDAASRISPELPFVAVAISGDGQWVLSGSAATLLESAGLSSGSSVLSGAEHVAVAINRVAQRPRVLMMLVGHSDRVAAAALSHDGSRMLTGSADGTAMLWTQSPFADAPGDPSPAADGEFVPPVLERAHLLHRLAGHEGAVSAVAVSANGQLALTGDAAGTVRLWDVASGELIRKFAVSATRIWSVALSADGRRVLAGCGDGEAAALDANTGDELSRFRSEGLNRPMASAALSADGTFAAIGSCDNEAFIWEVATGALRAKLIGYAGWGAPVALSADGKRAFFGGKTPMICDSATGTAMTPLDKGNLDQATAVALAVSADGRTIHFADRNADAASVAAGVGQALIPLRGHRLPALGVSYEQNGARIVSWSADATLVRDSQTLKILERRRGKTDGGHLLQNSPDGKRRVQIVGSQAFLADIARLEAESRLWIQAWQELQETRDQFRRAEEAEAARRARHQTAAQANKTR